MLEHGFGHGCADSLDLHSILVRLPIPPDVYSSLLLHSIDIFPSRTELHLSWP